MKNNKTNSSAPFLQVYKVLIKEFGLDAAALISELVFKQSMFSGDFFYEQKKIEKATGLSRHRQEKATEILIDSGILSIDKDKKGIPPKKFYRVNVEKYHELIGRLQEELPKKRRKIYNRSAVKN